LNLPITGNTKYFYSGGSSPTTQPMSSEFSVEKLESNVLCSSLNSQDYLNDYIQNHKVPLPDISSESNNEDGMCAYRTFYISINISFYFRQIFNH
jgi:hypothetical protein